MKVIRSNKQQEEPKEDFQSFLSGGMIGGIAQAGLGTAQMVYGMVENAKAKKEINKIKSAAPSLATPAAYYNYYKEAYDQTLMQTQLEDLNRSLATTAGALSQAGGRALVGGINEATRGSAYQKNILAERQNQLQGQALSTLAQAEENTINRKEDRYQTDLNYAWGAKQDAMNQIAGGASAVASGLSYGILDQVDANKDSLPKKSTNNNSKDYSKANTGGLTEEQKALLRKEHGGFVTDGEFNHDTNKIDVLQKGKKIAELTGNEVVLNPEQQKMLESKSAYAKKLFAKFRAQSNNKKK